MAVSLGVIKRKRVKSSNVYSHGFDDESQTYEIEFNSGSIWQYWPVTRSTYDRVDDAPSVGKAFNQEIRDKAENSKEVA